MTRSGSAAPSPRTASAVPSPCINVCRMNATSGLCEGCWRTLDEIAAWSALDDAARRAVWVQLEQRRGAWASVAAESRR